jgi:hypothetical protein
MPEAINVTGPGGDNVIGNKRRTRAPRRGPKPTSESGSPRKPVAKEGAGGDRSRRPRKPRTPKCFNCDSVGHLAKDCTEPTKPKVRD